MMVLYVLRIWAVYVLCNPDGEMLINQSLCSIKRKPTYEMGHRVWLLHRRMKHVPLRKLSQMLKDNLLIDSGVEAWEVDIVDAHQDCVACALT